MGVIVLGMHRSGTSAMTGALHELGLSVGDPDALIDASEHNPRGHWEVKSLVFLNEMLLHELGGSWSAPPAADRDDQLALAGSDWRTGAHSAHATRLPDDPWVWKDPRLCLLLDFWRAVLDEPPVVVMVVRSPHDVARSLSRRSGIEGPYGLALWERYTRSALTSAVGLPAWVVHYEELIAEPERAIRDVLGFLAAEGVAPNEPDVDAAVRITTWPTSARPAEEPAPDTFSPEQQQLRTVVEGLRGRLDPAGIDALGPETPGLRDLFETGAPSMPKVLRSATSEPPDESGGPV